MRKKNLNQCIESLQEGEEVRNLKRLTFDEEKTLKDFIKTLDLIIKESLLDIGIYEQQLIDRGVSIDHYCSGQSNGTFVLSDSIISNFNDLIKIYPHFSKRDIDDWFSAWLNNEKMVKLKSLWRNYLDVSSAELSLEDKYKSMFKVSSLIEFEKAKLGISKNISLLDNSSINKLSILKLRERRLKKNQENQSRELSELYNSTNFCYSVNSRKEIDSFFNIVDYFSDLRKWVFLNKKFQGEFIQENGEVNEEKQKSIEKWFNDKRRVDDYVKVLHLERESLLRISGKNYSRKGLIKPLNKDIDVAKYAKERITAIYDELDKIDSGEANYYSQYIENNPLFGGKEQVCLNCSAGDLNCNLLCSSEAQK